MCKQWLVGVLVMLGVAGCGMVASAENVAAAAGEAEQRDDIELPMERAVMFSSGVSYFEHAGVVDGDATVRLMFNRAQINDVLKSMIVVDEDGRVASVRYPTQDPLDRALGSFAVDLRSQPTLAELLRSLRGQMVTVHTPDAIRGRIVGVEQRQKAVDDTTVTEHLLTLATEAGLRNVTLERVRSVEFDDPRLQRELEQALLALGELRDQDRQPMDIRLVGEGEREVRIGYLVESPVWKTSYRLDLSRLTREAEDGQEDDAGAWLQGWAMVENMSEADWERVTLSLISGQPMSFVMDLHTPLYVDRPRLELPRHKSLVPRVHAEGMAADAVAVTPEQMQQRAARAVGGAGGGGGGRGGGAGLFDDGASRAVLQEDMQAAAAAMGVGELFQFTLDHPVSLQRGRSAMLPIVMEQLEAEKVSIYNRQDHATHPLNGVYLTNSTDLQLLAGPVTVLDEGVYAGDSLLDDMTPGESRLLSYGVDLQVLVDPSQRSDRRRLGVRILDGVLEMRDEIIYTQEYALRNRSPQERLLIIEQPRQRDRQLVEPEQPWETTPELYRFRVAVAADERQDFEVRERRTLREEIALLDWPIGQLVAIVQQGRMPEEIAAALEGVIEARREVSRLEQRLRDRQSRREEIVRGQERLRENLRAVDPDTQLGQRYLQRLAAEEDELDELDEQMRELRNAIEQARQQLREEVGNLRIE